MIHIVIGSVKKVSQKDGRRGTLDRKVRVDTVLVKRFVEQATIFPYKRCFRLLDLDDLHFEQIARTANAPYIP